jgi:hypothetical protein
LTPGSSESHAIFSLSRLSELTLSNDESIFRLLKKRYCQDGQLPICDLKNLLNYCTHFLTDLSKRYTLVVNIIEELIENLAKPDKFFYSREFVFW